MTKITITETQEITKKVTVCDRCGITSLLQCSIHQCHICRRDYCYDCKGKHPNEDPEWYHICKDCAAVGKDELFIEKQRMEQERHLTKLHQIDDEWRQHMKDKGIEVKE